MVAYLYRGKGWPCIEAAEGDRGRSGHRAKSKGEWVFGASLWSKRIWWMRSGKRAWKQLAKKRGCQPDCKLISRFISTTN
jgi:hypothetical protein